ncbi:MAG TPA: type II toxin-antitoxin system VapC family toxin [Thermoanaerobaculia bacterium]|nr:type II toxin-antitoxin system VapC family toxin [Thermoanaerobaculia bacterium]
MGGEPLILLDTHALIWLISTNSSLGRSSKESIDRAFATDQVCVSAVSFWEVAMLASKRRITLNDKVSVWRSNVLKLGIVEIPFRGDIAIAAVELPRLHGDPADRAIVATAMLHEAILYTADDRLLRWRSPLRRFDARK